jgi:branched-chain amino acid transport system permease protein
VQLFVEQLLNGVQFGVMLFLMAAGLTLIFGAMGVINLAHGSLYMIGAYGAAFAGARTGSFVLAILAGCAAAALAGVLIELAVIRRLYTRSHLDQVLATFGLILFCNEGTAMLFGREPLFSEIPPQLTGSVPLLLGITYPAYRILIIAAGLVIALLLYLLLQKTRIGMLVRAGATHRDIVRALGVSIRAVFTLVFGLGACLAGLAGAIAGPLLSVQVGMGEQILILTLVVIVIGGVGSVRGAFVGALIVGVTDTMIRIFLPGFLLLFLSNTEGVDALAAGLSSMSVYLLMAAVLLWRPRGLFAAYD